MNSPFFPLPDPRSDELHWMTEALCTQVPADVFFPEKGQSADDALMICEDCSVQFDCLQYAVETGQRFGIWGGMTERERRKIRRTPAKRSLKAPHGTSARYRQHHRDNERACTACRDAEKLRRQELRERRSS